MARNYDKRKVNSFDRKIKDLEIENEIQVYDPKSDEDDFNNLEKSLVSTEFTTKESNFIDYMLMGYDKFEAASKAKYSTHSASRIAEALMKSPKIQRELAIRRDKLATKHEISIDRVTQEMAKIAFSNMQDFFDAEGNIKKISDLTREQAAVISSCELEDGNIKKFKLYDKKSELDTLGKHLGIFEKDNTLIIEYGLKKILALLPEEVRQQALMSMMKQVEGNKRL